MRGPSFGSSEFADGAIPVSQTVRVTGPAPPSAIPPAAVPVVPVRQRRPSPVLPALCCLGLILFLIAATIVLSLIPLYPRERDVDAVPFETQVNASFPVANGVTIPNGELNPSQRAALQSSLQNNLNANIPNNDATVSVVQGTAVNTATTRKRQALGRFINCRLILTYRGGRFRLRRILLILISFTIDSNLGTQLSQLGTSGTGTGTATTTSQPVTTTANTTNSTRQLVRRSLEEGGAPAGVIYIDANEVAGAKGNVSVVSFYADESCTLSTVEFGAFELMNRDLNANTAELVLRQRSGPLALSAKMRLRSYMDLVTIRLCSEESIKAGDKRCQGQQFSVLPHQYIGIYSDTCRLGFAPVHVSPFYRTTWKAEGDLDSFGKVHYRPADYTVLHSVTIDEADAHRSQNVNKPAAPKALFVGSYPPRRCGLATFLEDLASNYPGPYGVVAVDEHSTGVIDRTYPENVVYRLNQTDRSSYYAVADLLNNGDYDVINVQHEYALYGGMGGEYVLALLSAANKPVILTMHTIPSNPSATYKSITRAAVALATRVVVLSEVGRRLLILNYGVDESKIVVVPHGVPDVPYAASLTEAKAKLGIDKDVPVISTFGLLSRNKNIQLALKALQTTVQTIPNVLYLVIGQIHPSIQSSEGESYRMELESNVTALGLTRNVEFLDKFVSDNELLDYLAASDAYLTPYAQEDQYVSGTLSWAVGVGKAVVSTPYLYAKELLADGRGFLVPFGDPQALSSTLARILTDDNLRNSARQAAYKYGRHMTWTSVGNQLKELFTQLITTA